MKKILRILFGLSLGVLAVFFGGCSLASADENVTEIPVDITDISSSLTISYSCGNKSGYASATDTMKRSDLRADQSRIGSGFNDAFQVYLPYAVNPSRVPLTDIVFDSYNYGNALPINIGQCNYMVSYDMPQLGGYYQVTCDFYVGVTIFQLRGNANTLTNSFTTDSVTDTYFDQYNHYFTVSFVDANETVTFQNNGLDQTSNLLHFQAVYTGSNTPDPLELDIAQYVADHITAWQASGVFGNGYQNTYYMFQAFSELEVLYMVSPPVTPTPTPTPSPNQDIIDNSNTNTTNIITNINDGFDDLSNFLEDTLPGMIAKALFGDPVDWVEFLVEVQGDLLDFIPLSDLVDELTELFVAFYGTDLTERNPLNLAFVDGWKSDLYSIEVPALPLVINGVSYEFIPQFSFSFNNPLMNLIRPYVLTFMNVLITILFLRYLIDYFYRWTQLVAGNTSVAFQLLHHDEAEKDHVESQDLGSSGYHAKSNNSYEREYPDEYYESLIKIHRNE